jgi:hypothetical protein
MHILIIKEKCKKKLINLKNIINWVKIFALHLQRVKFLNMYINKEMTKD